MKKGVLIFAHNSKEVDYVSLAIISGKLAKKYLKVPVSLATDADTLGIIISSKLKTDVFETFDKVIKIDQEKKTDNKRIIYDRDFSKVIPFINNSRPNAYEVSPYERTLLIDSDFLIFSDTLGNYWDCDSSIMISDSFINLRNETNHIFDKQISETGPPLRWATTVMFSKNEESKIFFNLVSHIRDQYIFYSNLYQFNPKIYRNDISFSIAKHILDRFEIDDKNNLPPILSLIDRDNIEKVKDDGTLIFSLGNDRNNSEYILSSIKNKDVHVMNKNAIIRHYDELLGLT